MQRKALLLSLVTALAGVVLAHLYLRRLEEEVAGGPPVSVLVATRDLKPGSVLSDAVLAIRPIPRAYVGQRNVLASDLQQVLGVRVSTLVTANEPLLWSDVATLIAPGRDLSSAVQEGRRALSLSGNNLTFDGLLRPGDRVDVLFTRAGGEATTTLLQNLLVLAVGGRLFAEDGARTTRTTRESVTVGVSSEQGLLLVQAEQQGSLALVLRNPDDIAIIDALPEARRRDVVLGGMAPTPAPEAAPRTKREIDRVH